MTRINSNIPPEELHTVHLLAEWRELPRVFIMSAKAESRGFYPSWLELDYPERPYMIPEKFTLGKGHMMFFADKLKFLYSRFDSICNELKKRKIKLSYDTIRADCNIPYNSCWYQQWVSTEQDDDLVRERIIERVAANRKKYNFPDDVELNQETWSDHVKKDREQRIRGK